MTVAFRVQALPQSDIVPRWSNHDTLAEAKAKAAQFDDVAGWHHVQIRDHNGNVVWDRDHDGFDALIAASKEKE